jgi:Leucine-rich repeat (LRR) protein
MREFIREESATAGIDFGAPVVVQAIFFGVDQVQASKKFVQGVSQFTGLKRLDLSNVEGLEVDKETMSPLSSLKRLVDLVLSNGIIRTGSSQDNSLENLPGSLRRLDLSNCSGMKDVWWEAAVQTLPPLTTLILSGTDIGDDGVAATANSLHSSLRMLVLDDCVSVTKDGMWQMLQSKLRLENLAIARSFSIGGLTSGMATAFSDSRVLASKGLQLQGCMLPADKEQLQLLAVDSRLEELSLSDTSVSAEAICEVLHKTTGLNLLNLEDATCLRLPSIELAKKLAGLTSLTCLDVSRFLHHDGRYVLTHEGLEDAHVRELASLTNLRKLRLANNIRLTDNGISALSALSNLLELDLAGLAFSANALSEVAARLTGLRVLVLKRCSKVGDWAMRGLSSLSNLRKLDLSNTKVTCGGLGSIGLDSMTNLEVLHLAGMGSRSWNTNTSAHLLDLNSYSALREVVIPDLFYVNMKNYSKLSSTGPLIPNPDFNLMVPDHGNNACEFIHTRIYRPYLDIGKFVPETKMRTFAVCVCACQCTCNASIE